MIEAYKLAYGRTCKELEGDVNYYLTQGWELHGPTMMAVIDCQSRFYQPLVKRQEYTAQSDGPN